MNGIGGHGIPPLPPTFSWLATPTDADGEPVGFTLELIRTLLPSAFTMRSSGRSDHCCAPWCPMACRAAQPQRRIDGSGIGNMVAPLLRWHTGDCRHRTHGCQRQGQWHLAAVLGRSRPVHPGVDRFPVAAARVPDGAMAALLLVVAWNMGSTTFRPYPALRRAMTSSCC